MEEPVDCLVVMPFGKDASERAISNLVYEGIITPALDLAGVKGDRIDRDPLGKSLIRPTLLERLNRAPAMIADVSWNNPNVIFELGYRKALGRDFVIISLTPDDAAWWLKGHHIIDAPDGDAIQNIAKAVRKQLTGSSVVSELKVQLLQSANELEDQLPIMNSFIDRVAAWRLSRAREDMQTIRDGRIVFRAKSFTGYIGYNFSALMKLINAGETYFTVSNIRFWTDKGVEESNFLLENKHAADRGVHIKRVILVDKKKLGRSLAKKKGKIYRVLREHSRIRNSSDQCKNNMLVKVLPLANVKLEMENYGHSGMLFDSEEKKIDKSWSLLVTSVHGPNLLEGIELHFGAKRSRNDDEVQRVLRQFQRAYNHRSAKHIDKVLGLASSTH